jgi:hypothetical protein
MRAARRLIGDSVKHDPQRIDLKQLLQDRTSCAARSDEPSSEMANEACPNDPVISVADATGYSGTEDDTN